MRAVTYCVENLNASQSAWETHLKYQLVERGQLSDTLSAVWDAPAESGLGFCLLQPESGSPTFVRLVETGPRPGYWPDLSWGWNVTEFLTEDPDALARNLTHLRST